MSGTSTPRSEESNSRGGASEFSPPPTDTKAIKRKLTDSAKRLRQAEHRLEQLKLTPVEAYLKLNDPQAPKNPEVTAQLLEIIELQKTPTRPQKANEAATMDGKKKLIFTSQRALELYNDINKFLESSNNTPKTRKVAETFQTDIQSSMSGTKKPSHIEIQLAAAASPLRAMLNGLAPENELRKALDGIYDPKLKQRYEESPFDELAKKRASDIIKTLNDLINLRSELRRQISLNPKKTLHNNRIIQRYTYVRDNLVGALERYKQTKQYENYESLKHLLTLFTSASVSEEDNKPSASSLLIELKNTKQVTTKNYKQLQLLENTLIKQLALVQYTPSDIEAIVGTVTKLRILQINQNTYSQLSEQISHTEEQLAQKKKELQDTLQQSREVDTYLQSLKLKCLSAQAQTEELQKTAQQASLQTQQAESRAATAINAQKEAEQSMQEMLKVRKVEMQKLADAREEINQAKKEALIAQNAAKQGQLDLKRIENEILHLRQTQTQEKHKLENEIKHLINEQEKEKQALKDVRAQNNKLKLEVKDLNSTNADLNRINARLNSTVLNLTKQINESRLSAVNATDNSTMNSEVNKSVIQRMREQQKVRITQRVQSLPRPLQEALTAITQCTQNTPELRPQLVFMILKGMYFMPFIPLKHRLGNLAQNHEELQKALDNIEDHGDTKLTPSTLKKIVKLYQDGYFKDGKLPKCDNVTYLQFFSEALYVLTYLPDLRLSAIELAYQHLGKNVSSLAKVIFAILAGMEQLDEQPGLTLRKSIRRHMKKETYNELPDNFKKAIKNLETTPGAEKDLPLTKDLCDNIAKLYHTGHFPERPGSNNERQQHFENLFKNNRLGNGLAERNGGLPRHSTQKNKR